MLKERNVSQKRRSEIQARFPRAELLGVGRRSVVLKSGDVVIKVEKDSHPGTAFREAHWLRRLNRYGIGPKLVSFSKGSGYVVYEYVDGVTLPEFIEKGEPEALAKVLRACLEKAGKLDELGVNKEEMHRPVKHIWVKGDVKLIDFERCHEGERPKNVTQLCHFLFIGDNPSAKRVRKVFRIGKQGALAAVKQYRKEGLEPILLLLDLDHVPKG